MLADKKRCFRAHRADWRGGRRSAGRVPGQPYRPGCGKASARAICAAAGLISIPYRSRRGARVLHTASGSFGMAGGGPGRVPPCPPCPGSRGPGPPSRSQPGLPLPAPPSGSSGAVGPPGGGGVCVLVCCEGERWGDCGLVCCCFGLGIFGGLVLLLFLWFFSLASGKKRAICLQRPSTPM